MGGVQEAAGAERFARHTLQDRPGAVCDMREPIGAAEDGLAHPGVPQLRASYRWGTTVVDSQRSPPAIQAGWHTATPCAGSTGARARRSSPMRGTHDPTCTCFCRIRGRRDSRRPQALRAESAPRPCMQDSRREKRGAPPCWTLPRQDESPAPPATCGVAAQRFRCARDHSVSCGASADPACVLP